MAQSPLRHLKSFFKPEPELARDTLLTMYYYLRLTRALKERLGILYRQGRILGGVCLSTGQEAVSVGAASVLGPDDVIVPSHRDWGAHLVRGIEPKEILAHTLIV